MSGGRSLALVVWTPGDVALEERDAPVPGPEGRAHPAGRGRGGHTALAAARRGGAVVLIGLPPHGGTAAVPVDDLVNNDRTVRGSVSYTSSAWRDVVALLNPRRLRLDFLVTHRFALADWQQALDALRGPESPHGRVMLTIGSPQAPPEVRS